MNYTQVVRAWLETHSEPFKASQVAEAVKLPAWRVRGVLDGLMRSGAIVKLPGKKVRVKDHPSDSGRWCERCWQKAGGK